MNLLIIGLTIFAVMVCSVVLLVSSVLHIVEKGISARVGIALLLFVCVPMSVFYLKFTLPIILLTILGYAVICLGNWARRKLLEVKEQILEGLKENLNKENLNKEDLSKEELSKEELARFARRERPHDSWVKNFVKECNSKDTSFDNV